MYVHLFLSYSIQVAIRILLDVIRACKLVGNILLFLRSLERGLLINEQVTFHYY